MAWPPVVIFDQKSDLHLFIGANRIRHPITELLHSRCYFGLGGSLLILVLAAVRC